MKREATLTLTRQQMNDLRFAEGQLAERRNQFEPSYQGHRNCERVRKTLEQIVKDWKAA